MEVVFWLFCTAIGAAALILGLLQAAGRIKPDSVLYCALGPTTTMECVIGLAMLAMFGSIARLRGSIVVLKPGMLMLSGVFRRSLQIPLAEPIAIDRRFVLLRLGRFEVETNIPVAGVFRLKTTGHIVYLNIERTGLPAVGESDVIRRLAEYTGHAD
jgi:hypothetical protein